MVRPPSFPPTVPPRGSRERPREVEAELRRYAAQVAAEQEAESRVVAPSEPPADIPAPESAVSLRLRERLAELRGARRRARLRTLGIVGGAVALVLLLAWVVVFSPLLAFKLDELSVQGTSEYVTKADVSAIMAAHDGTPLLRLDTREIARELEEKHAVKNVEFEREWPSGVTVKITPREAVAATPTKGGFRVLDGEGVELATVTEPVAGLPVIKLTDSDDQLADSIVAVLHVMDALPPQIRERVTDVGARTASDVHFTLDNGAKVIWGSDEDSELKAEVLEMLLEQPAKIYNITTPLTPITS